MPTLPTPITPYYGGGQVANPANVIQTSGAPSSVFSENGLGTLAVDNAAGNVYALASKSGGVSTWVLLGGSSGAISAVNGTTNQITVVTAGNIATVSMPSAITTPGSLTATSSLAAGTTVVGGTGVTATTGNVVATVGQVNAGTTMTAGTGITATTGNIVASAGQVNAGTTMTAGTGLTVTTGNLAVSAGNANITGNVVASKSSAGVAVTVQATNSDNTNSASNSGVEIAAGGSSGGDPYLSFQISGVGASTMTMGLDNSSSDTFVISNSAAIGTSNALSLTQAGALTTASTIESTVGNITATNGNLVMGTAGNKIIVPTGANASAGLSAAMSGTPGAVAVSTTACSGTALVFYSRATAGGTVGNVSITAQDGTGFTLTSDANETSTFNWWIINA